MVSLPPHAKMPVGVCTCIPTGCGGAAAAPVPGHHHSLSPSSTAIRTLPAALARMHAYACTQQHACRLWVLMHLPFPPASWLLPGGRRPPAVSSPSAPSCFWHPPPPSCTALPTTFPCSLPTLPCPACRLPHSAGATVPARASAAVPGGGGTACCAQRRPGQTVG